MMKDKLTLLGEIEQALKDGVITYSEVATLIGADDQPHDVAAKASPELEDSKKSDKLSAVDVMFYVAGVILFSAIASVIAQTWDPSYALMHVILCVVAGAGLWGVALYLIRSTEQSDVRKGLTNALLLTGSLVLGMAGYIGINEPFEIGITESTSATFSVLYAVTLLILGALHFIYDKYVKRDFTLLMAILLCVASFPVLASGLLVESSPPVDVYSVIALITTGLLAGTTRTVAKLMQSRRHIRASLDSFAVILAFSVMYLSSFGTYAALWLIVLIASILGVFYLSITLQKKNLLGVASVFLVLAIIATSFKYFSGYGVTTSLFIAAIGLISTGVAAAGINKKYFSSGEVATTKRAKENE